MNAAVEFVENRGLDQYERAALRRELSRWGRWQERAEAFNGYPSMDAVERARIGRGGGTLGHRVLMLDMPDDVWATNARVMRLPEELRSVLRAIFVNVLMPDGSLISYAERSARVNMPERTARRKVEEAMRYIAGVSPL